MQLSQRSSLEEGASPKADQNVPWSREFEAAEIDASKYTPQVLSLTLFYPCLHLNSLVALNVSQYSSACFKNPL